MSVTFFGVVEAGAAEDFGPLQTTNRFPLHMLVLTPRAVDAQLPPKGTLTSTLALEYSNTYFNHRNPRWDIIIDTELLVAELSSVYGLTEKVAVRLDVPMMSMQDGFLDGFLQNYHNLIGVPNYDREDRPKNKFFYRVTKDGQLWVQGQGGGLQLGDIRGAVQYALPNVGIFSSSILVTLKAPTGDADSGLGSGRYDVGGFVPMKWRGERWSFFLMPGFIRVDDPKTLGARVSARNSIGLLAGTAFQYNEKWRWLAQLNYYSSPFEKSGLDELDKGALELVFGLQRSLGASAYWEFAFSEDLTLAVPDFNMRLGVTWRFLD